MSRPSADQIEITTFGPGFGECIVVHLGANKWMVVDSCIDTASGEPSGLKYLRDLGVDPGQVIMVVATHWHDDHIRGMAQQLEAFGKARFCSSSALSRTEFLATILKYNSRHGIVAGSGASEMCRVLEILRSRVGGTVPLRAFPGRPILSIPAAETGHGVECTVTTLSPSDKQFEKFLGSLGAMAPIPKAAKRRIGDQNPNDLSVVTLISFGDQTLLLGADLEESGDIELGWSAIVRLDNRPPGASCVFKIPHHGSCNAHSDEVWMQMLLKNPIAILTPWNRNKGLPTGADVDRLRKQTHSGFITSVGSSPTLDRARPYAVQKQIRETVGRLRASQGTTGYIRVRNGGLKNPKLWCISHSENARHLDDWKAA